MPAQDTPGVNNAHEVLRSSGLVTNVQAPVSATSSSELHLHNFRQESTMLTRPCGVQWFGGRTLVSTRSSQPEDVLVAPPSKRPNKKQTKTSPLRGSERPGKLETKPIARISSNRQCSQSFHLNNAAPRHLTTTGHHTMGLPTHGPLGRPARNHAAAVSRLTTTRWVCQRKVPWTNQPGTMQPQPHG